MKKQVLAVSLAGSLLLLSGCGEKVAVIQQEDWAEYVTLGDYKGIAVTIMDYTVTDEQVQAYIDEMLGEYATFAPVERAVALGDTVNIDYVGTIDGVAFEGGSLTDDEMIADETAYLSDLGLSLVGHEAGDTFTVSFTMPGYYWADEVAGKAVSYEVQVNQVLEQELPVLDDEMVLMLSDESTTVKEYYEEMQGVLEEQAGYYEQSDIEQAVWDEVVTRAEIKSYPNQELEQYKEEAMSFYQNEADENGAELDEYLQQVYGTSLEEMIADTEEYAKQDIMEQMVVRAIAVAENLELTENEYQALALEEANTYGYETVEEFEEGQDKDDIYQMLLQRRVLAFLVENAKVTVSDELYSDMVIDETFNKENDVKLDGKEQLVENDTQLDGKEQLVESDVDNTDEGVMIGMEEDDILFDADEDFLEEE